MKLVAALQKEARKLTKVKAEVERQLNAISAAVKAFGSTLAAESADGRRKKRGGRKGHKMSAAGRKAIAEAQRLRWAKQKKETEKRKNHNSTSDGSEFVAPRRPHTATTNSTTRDSRTSVHLQVRLVA